VEDWKISKATLARRNAACDEFRAVFADKSAASGAAAGDIVELFDNGVRRFYGRVVKVPASSSGDSESLEILAKSPWNDLEETVYQQQWKIRHISDGQASLDAFYRSRVVLGQDADAKQIGARAQMLDILNYAIMCGAEISIGEISADTQMLLDETKDITCAEAAARTLKWLPNSAVWFDYAGDGFPSLNISPREALPTAEIRAEDGRVKKFSASARPDLVVSGVSIKYESENTEGEYSWLTVSEDNYPDGFNPASKKAIVMNVELAGYKATCQKYQAVCESIQPSSPAWWKSRVPSLADAQSLSVSAYSREGSLPLELVSGSLGNCLGIDGASDIVRATVSYDDGEGGTVTRDVGVKLMSTRAASGTHCAWTTTQAAETAPQGLAKAIYEAVSEMQYEGEISLIGSKSENYVGRRLRVLGAGTQWENMNSPVVSASEDLFTEILTLRFGPPKHLYPDELAELFRINRNRKVSTSIETRSTGKISASTVEMSAQNSSTSSDGGDAKYSQMILKDAAAEVSINLKCSALSEGQSAAFRYVNICHEGRPAKAMFLMTEPEFITVGETT